MPAVAVALVVPGLNSPEALGKWSTKANLSVLATLTGEAPAPDLGRTRKPRLGLALTRGFALSYIAADRSTTPLLRHRFVLPMPSTGAAVKAPLLLVLVSRFGCSCSLVFGSEL